MVSRRNEIYDPAPGRGHPVSWRPDPIPAALQLEVMQRAAELLGLPRPTSIRAGVHVLLPQLRQMARERAAEPTPTAGERGRDAADTDARREPESFGPIETHIVRVDAHGRPSIPAGEKGPDSRIEKYGNVTMHVVRRAI